MVTLTPEQSALLLARALNEPPHAGAQRETSLYMPILLALHTGVRRGEVLALRWKNVDLDSGIIRIYEQAEECKSQPTLIKLPKGKKRRVITLSALAVVELRRHKLEQAERLLHFGIRQDSDSLVCGKFDGRLYEPTALTATFADFVKRFGNQLPVGVTFHTLRHTHATLLLGSGVDIKTVSERLGHASAVTTLQIYVHATKQTRDEAAAKTDAIFRQKS
jgi:integrase